MDPVTLFLILVLIVSVIIHEVAHGFAAELQGDPTARLQGRLTLNPIPHIDIIGSILLPALLVLSGSGFLFGWAKPVPYNPYNLRNQRWGEALVAAAGPGVNLALALIFGLTIRFAGGVLPTGFVLLAAVVVYVNILLALFNLIPVPPLDGSKLLRSGLPYRASLAFQHFEQKLVGSGFLVLIVVLWLTMSLLAPVLDAVLSLLFTAITGVPLHALVTP